MADASLVVPRVPSPTSSVRCFFKYGRYILSSQWDAQCVMSLWEAESMAFSNKENNAIS